MLGLGGGLVTVPVLMSFGTSMKKAVGTSAFLTLMVMTTGASSFFFFEGGIHTMAFIVIGISAVCFAPIGAFLAHKLHSRILRRLFGGLLCLVGLVLLVK